MQYHRGNDVVHRNGFTTALALAIGAVWVSGAIGAVVTGNEALPIILPVALLVMPIVVYGGGLRPRVILTADDVVIHGQFLTETVPYGHIEGLAFSGSFMGYRWLQIDRGHGWMVNVTPFNAAVIPWTDPTWQRKLKEDIEAKIGSARPDEPQY